jgi:hypothetical protein
MTNIDVFGMVCYEYRKKTRQNNEYRPIFADIHHTYDAMIIAMTCYAMANAQKRKRH